MQIGVTAAVERFRLRHTQFFEGSDFLEQAISAAFDHKVNTQDRLGLTIVLLGTRCVSDFREILLLAANGFGWGATSHLRGMFERTVTAAYLYENPQAVNDFVDYEFIRRWKGVSVIESIFGLSPENESTKATLKADFERVRERFLVPSCEKCKTTRPNHTWSRLDVVSMAKQIQQPNFAPLVIPAYYLPLAQMHSTFASIYHRIGQLDTEIYGPDEAAADAEADRSLQYAHLVLLNILFVQHRQFKIASLGPHMERAFEHFDHAWRKT